MEASVPRRRSVPTDQQAASAASASKSISSNEVFWTRERLNELEKLVVNPHFEPADRTDRIAMNLVRLVDGIVELSTMNRPFLQALMMETLGVVPGLVAYPYHRLRSMFSTGKESEWCEPAMQEALREPWHLRTWVAVMGTNIFTRVFFAAFAAMQFFMWLVLYIPFFVLFPRLAHRFNGYLEEMAVGRYTRILQMIDSGAAENVPAPLLSTLHWKLPTDARIRDVVLLIRAEESDFREVHHYISSNYTQMRDKLDLDLSQTQEPSKLKLDDNAASRVLRPGHSLPSMAGGTATPSDMTFGEKVGARQGFAVPPTSGA